jgi:hypothetical protein
LAAHPSWSQVKLTDAYDNPLALLDAMHGKREKAYFKILELKYVLGYQGLDLLQKLLDLDPQTRMTAA